MHIRLFSGLFWLFLALSACRAVAPTPTSVSPTAVPKAASPTAIPTPTPDPLAPPTIRLRAGDLLLAADIDDIPAIFADDDLFVDAAAGSAEWPDEELVIALTFNGDARAYPVRLLSLHEIVNDTIGGQPVLVTWCPLCFSALAFNPVVDGRTLTFGVSGYLYNDNLVMYDHQTNTLWSQLVGQGIRGAQRGQQLAVLPSLITTWGEWKQLHPDTRILSAEQLGRQADDIIDPYAGYYASGAAGFSTDLNQNDLLPAKTLVIGLVAGEKARAYPLEMVRSQGFVQDQLGILPILLIFDEELETVLAYRPEIDGQRLTLAPAARPGFFVDKETGSVWNGRAGEAVEGALAEREWPQLSGPLVFWFAWSAFHPATDVYGES